MKAAAFFSKRPGAGEEIGILHDIDFKKIGGDMRQHGIASARILQAAGLPDGICGMAQRHNHHLHSGSNDRPARIMLQAAVSVPGRVTAFALIWGGRLSDVTVKTMTGKAREKPFAAGCDRDRIVTVAPFMDLPVFL